MILTVLSARGFTKGLYMGLLYLFAGEKVETKRKEAIYPRSPRKLIVLQEGKPMNPEVHAVFLPTVPSFPRKQTSPLKFPVSIW